MNTTRVTITEAAQILGRKPDTLRKWIQDGCPHEKEGDSIRLSISQVFDWKVRHAELPLGKAEAIARDLPEMTMKAEAQDAAIDEMLKPQEFQCGFYPLTGEFIVHSNHWSDEGRAIHHTRISNPKGMLDWLLHLHSKDEEEAIGPFLDSFEKWSVEVHGKYPQDFLGVICAMRAKPEQRDPMEELHEAVRRNEIPSLLRSIEGHLAKLASTVKSGTRHRTGTPSITTGHWND